MTGKSHALKFIGPAILALSAGAGLYFVFVLYHAGQVMLALIFLGLLALGTYIYSASAAYAYRYLFPGIAGAVVFVLFPLIYTVSIGFTNFSSKNLLPYERARQYLLDEADRASDIGYAMSLHAEGRAFRIRLEHPETHKAYVSEPLALRKSASLDVPIAQLKDSASALPGDALPLKDIIAHQTALKALTLVLPDKTALRMTGLREYAAAERVYEERPDGALRKKKTGELIKPNFKTGFFETPDGRSLQPGFKVNVGLANFIQIFSDQAFREPFFRIFIWTVVFSTITVLATTSLGMVLAVLLNWDALRFRGVYRTLLFLPYAVPGFISILVFKGLFNNNFGEINLVLDALFGIRPAWFSDPALAKLMILLVNTWLGYPYMMVVCMGLIKAIPSDLYEASALAGAGPITNFFRITLPLIIKPLTPLMIASFAFNFNNFVLINLLTAGRPDFLDTRLPAGTTDLLVSYTYRIAFEDSGQNFGLAAAISTLIFILVAMLSVVNMRLTRVNKA
ncbi:maltose ABC transporter permease MalF [Noviherbaspirillum sp.]|jgi:maltose/maltodextrin transport system permease protein|uniref:maltose ABC transporter permease MalF n=1 Tax=Noviherbaspirillum sp. TaxID=1926288 RepID=UPI0025D61FD4|nr:maltose ABC transporter permease MalF [Noviherbaspirillum sp.]